MLFILWYGCSVLHLFKCVVVISPFMTRPLLLHFKQDILVIYTFMRCPLWNYKLLCWVSNNAYCMLRMHLGMCVIHDYRQNTNVVYLNSDVTQHCNLQRNSNLWLQFYLIYSRKCFNIVYTGKAMLNWVVGILIF